MVKQKRNMSPKYSSSSSIFLLRVAPGFNPCDKRKFKQSITFGLSALQSTLLMGGKEEEEKKHSSRRYKKITFHSARLLMPQNMGKKEKGKRETKEKKKTTEDVCMADYYRWMGTPSLAGGGLTLASLSFADSAVVPSESSAVVPCCKKLASLEEPRPWKPIEPGWPLMLLPGTCCPWALALPPLLAAAGLLAPGEVAVR